MSSVEKIKTKRVQIPCMVLSAWLSRVVLFIFLFKSVKRGLRSDIPVNYVRFIVTKQPANFKKKQQYTFSRARNQIPGRL